MFSFILLLFFQRFFSMWTISKVCIAFVTILLLLLIFWFFGLKAYGIVTPQPGIKPTSLAVEGDVLTTGLPGKFLFAFKH